MSKELEEADRIWKLAMQGFKSHTARFKCPKAKTFIDECLKGAREGYKMAKMKTK